LFHSKFKIFNKLGFIIKIFFLRLFFFHALSNITATIVETRHVDMLFKRKLLHCLRLWRKSTFTVTGPQSAQLYTVSAACCKNNRQNQKRKTVIIVVHEPTRKPWWHRIALLNNNIALLLLYNSTFFFIFFFFTFWRNRGCTETAFASLRHHLLCDIAIITPSALNLNAVSLFQEMRVKCHYFKIFYGLKPATVFFSCFHHFTCYSLPHTVSFCVELTSASFRDRHRSLIKLKCPINIPFAQQIQQDITRAATAIIIIFIIKYISIVSNGKLEVDKCLYMYITFLLHYFLCCRNIISLLFIVLILKFVFSVILLIEDKLCQKRNHIFWCTYQVL
jgi:hypothetical protein